MKRNRHTIIPLLAEFYGPDQASKWWARWKVFFIVCAELFGFDGGNAWFVSHYRLANRG